MFKEDFKDHLNDVKDEFEKYVDKRIDLLKLHIVEELSRFTAGFAVKMGILYLLFFALMFISIAGAYFLGHLLESVTLGFLFISGFYFLLAWMFYLLRRKLVEKPVIRSFVKLFFPKFEDDDE
ncbi:phage holin family protein [Natronoflexus pectinivorans]|uniref:Putative superfamily III holin-X n=1 Tax=Natronoflexus pectinivorans TaxID=682526 RepID=A0A4R2GKW3_9BACT|nr:phage holin family protein [Natronoflexus pectinivorans]TCO09207.1 putative superfamily III holin-X [Natronoflexus pectinivorans]